MTQPHSRTAWTKFKHWLYADPPFVWGDHTALARIKFWAARFVRFCWRWRDISPGPLFVAVAWLWGHSPIRLLPFPRLPLWGLALVGAAISVWSVHFDSSRGKTANKDRTATKAKRHWQKVALDCKFEEIPKLRWSAVKDHATTLNVELIEGTNERKLYLDATRKLHTIYQKPVKFRTNGDGTANIRILHSDPLHDEPTLPAFLGNDDGPILEPRYNWMPFGIDDDAEVFGYSPFENHLLIGGQTGSGKSSTAAADACASLAARHVEIAACIDPENATWRFIRDHVPYAGNAAAGLELLRDEHRILEKRTALLDELDTSLLVPTARTPLRRIYIDELQNLLNKELHGDDYVNEFRTLLHDILDRGRKRGITVTAVCTNPRKTILTEGLRDQFTYRACFKVADGTASQIVLGQVEKYYEPHKLPKSPGRCVFKGEEWHQLRTYRAWDQQARKAVASLRPAPAATGDPIAMPPASPQTAPITDTSSDFHDQLPPRRRRISRDETRQLIVAHLQRHPAALISEMAEDLQMPESNIRYWFSDKCSNRIPVHKVGGYRYELVR